MKALTYFLTRIIASEGTSFFEWLFSAAISSALLALIIAAIAKANNKDFGEWFQGSFCLLGGIEFIIYVISVIFS